MRAFAERLIICETKGNRSSASGLPAAFSVYGKLQPQMATLMGNTGFRSLLSRALALAGAKESCLNVLQIKSDGTFEGLDEFAQEDSEEIAEGGVVLVGQFLGLLVEFIGEGLTLRLVCEVWPKLSVTDLEFGKGKQNHENAK